MKKILFLLISLTILFTGHALANTSPSQGVPVLMYHSVANIPNNPAVISPDKFKKQMKFLKDNGYTPISLEDLYSFLTKNSYKLPAKPIVITLDDGYRDTYTTVMPILKQYNFKASLFLITNKIQKKVFSLEELQIMKKNGIEIHSHTNTHPDLRKLTKDAQEKEILASEKHITALNSKKSTFFCYPYGYNNKATLSLLKKHGYKMAFSNKPGWVKKGDNLLTLKRIYIGNNTTLENFKERVSKSNYSLKK